MGLFDRLFGRKSSRIERPTEEPQEEARANPAAAPTPPAAAPPSPQDQARAAEAERLMIDLLDEMVTSAATALARRGRGGAANTVYTMAAVAGQMAQAGAIRARAVAGLPLQAPDVVSAGTRDGRTYIFGDAIAAALIGQAKDPGVLWLAAGTAGLPLDQTILADLFGHAASTVGKPDFGRPRVDAGVSEELTIDQAVLDVRVVAPSLTRREIGQPLWTRMTALATRHALLAAARSRDMQALGRMALDAAVAGSRIHFEDIARG